MNSNLSEQQKYDPWEAQQEISNFKITVHCCRYLMLSEWNSENMACPFWRIYHSRQQESYVTFGGKTVFLAPDRIIVIPPNTSFSANLKSINLSHNESIKSIKIQNDSDIENFYKSGLTDQMFIHFNLGFPYDKVKPDVYEVVVNDELHKELIKDVEDNRLADPNTIGFQSNLRIYTLILSALYKLPSIVWDIQEIDNRILKTIHHIDKHLDSRLSNDELSNIVNLAPNSFARLFKDNMKNSVQQYIQQRRIDQSLLLLHHSDLSIEEISAQCGFYDRHHFSNTFKKLIGMPPVSYRFRMREN